MATYTVLMINVVDKKRIEQGADEGWMSYRDAERMVPKMRANHNLLLQRLADEAAAAAEEAEESDESEDSEDSGEEDASEEEASDEESEEEAEEEESEEEAEEEE